MNYKELFESKYKGRKVFLTGHTGFKGTWMLKWLSSIGAVVKGYALEPSAELSLFDQIDGPSICESVIADIRDRDRLKKEIISFQPDYIFHLAAQPLVRASYIDPIYTYETNVMGTANLLDAVRFLDTECSVVVITTDKVYENLENGRAYQEDDKLGGYDPYSASKAASEIVVSSYRNSFFNVANIKEHGKYIASGRAGNVIGGGDWSADRIIPDIVRALSDGKSVTVRNPNSVRPWQHVVEPISGYLLLGAQQLSDPNALCRSFNFGPETDDKLIVKDLVDEAIAVWGQGSAAYPNLENQPHEAALLQLDIANAKSKLGWVPKYSARNAVGKSILEYKELLAGNTDIISQSITQYSTV